jgi:hypothetical protein
MDVRQEKLEKKANDLNRAEIWTRRFAKCTYFLVVLYLLFGTSEWFQHGTLLSEPPTVVVDSYITALVCVFVGWWLFRVSDAFQAITEIIKELSETV